MLITVAITIASLAGFLIGAWHGIEHGKRVGAGETIIRLRSYLAEMQAAEEQTAA